MKFSGMICHHPRTNRLDFGTNQVKIKVTEVSKTTGPNCMKFSGMICLHPRTNRLDFGTDQVKVKVTKRSKIYFCHNSLSFHPIHMKPTPKCSLFNSLSSDRSKVKVKVTKNSKTYFGPNTQFSSDSCETNGKRFAFQFPIL